MGSYIRNLVLLGIPVAALITFQQARIVETALFRKATVEEQSVVMMVARMRSSGTVPEGYRGTTTTTSTSNVNKKPTFVFYVGLPKTATSFMQCTLCANANVTGPILLHDNYEYVGTCPFNACHMEEKEPPKEFLRHRFHAFFTDSSRAQESLGPKDHSFQQSSHRVRRPVKLATELMEYVDAAYKRGRNALMIYEGGNIFPDDHIQVLAAYLNPKWNVEIVVGYRPLDEWLPSKFNSVYKLKLSGSWPGELKGNGEKIAKEVPLFDIDHPRKFSNMVQDFETYQKHPTHIVRDNYLLHFDNVQIMAQHRLPDASGRGDPILENLFCSIIPDAPNVCQHVVAGALEFPTARNPSVSVTEDQLAVAAYQAGLVWNRPVVAGHRRLVRELIRAHWEELHESTGYDFPLECWPEEKVDRLKQMSFELERRLFRDTWTEEQGDAHRRRFAATVAKNKFCHIDTEKTLKEAEWKSFFASVKLREALEDYAERHSEHYKVTDS